MAVERFPVEASHILMFARAVGEYDPAYTDPGGDVIAPPTFVQSSAQFDPDYFLRPKPDEDWFGSGKEPTGRKRSGDSGGGGAAAGGLHAEQHFTYHRHLRPGDVLRAEVKPGERWEKQSKRAGTLKFSETITEYYDQDDELVITARGIGVVTEKVIEGS